LRHDREESGMMGHQIGDEHENKDYETFPEGRKVSGYKSGKDIERCPAMTRRADNLPHMARLRARKDLGEFWYQCPGHGAAADDDGQRPPEPRILGVELAEKHIACTEGNKDRDERCDPDKVCQGLLEVEFLFIAKESGSDASIDKI